MSKPVEKRVIGECFLSCFKVCETFTPGTITLWKLGKIVLFLKTDMFVVQIPESDASILSISIDREASYMAAVNNQVIRNVKVGTQENYYL